MPPRMVLTRTAGGLVGQPNPLTAPEGGCLTLENCVCDRENVLAENRRGFDRFMALAGIASQLTEFRDRLHALVGTTLKYDLDGTGTPASYAGSYTPVDSNRMRFLEARLNLYWNDNTGIQRVDTLGGTPRPAGMPRALDVLFELSSGGGAWLGNNFQVAYRVVWVRLDANKVPLVGFPSSRYVVRNTTGSLKRVGLATTMPDGVIAGDFLYVYRSEQVSTSVPDPGDELFKIAEVVVTSIDVSAGGVSHLDNRDDVSLGDPLHTNPTIETINQANAVPPRAKDMASYKGVVCYLNGNREPFRKLTLLNVTSLTAEVSTITITGDQILTYTASAAENVGARKFRLWTTSDPETPTSQEAIRATMESFQRVVNQDSGNDSYYVQYVSEIEDPAGIVEIWGRGLNDGPFSLTVNSLATGSAFEPALPTSGTSIISDNQAKGNRIYYAKQDQPDAVPFINFDDIGEEWAVGQRVLALQDSLIIIMRVGIWRLTGDSVESFVIKPVDPSIKVFCKDAAVVLDNAVYALSDQGVVKVTENGISVMSWQTETGPIPQASIKKIFNFSNFEDITHAVGYQSDRKYLLWTQESGSDTYPRIAWCYNFFTQKWSTWRKSVQAGIVMRETDKLFVAHAVDQYALRERKSYATSLEDYQDEDIPVTINSITPLTDPDGNPYMDVTLTYSYTEATLAAGFLLRQTSSGMSAPITAVVANGGSSYTVTIDRSLPLLTTGSATVVLPIVAVIRFKPETAGNAGIIKRASVAQIYLENDGARNHEIGMFTDIKPQETYYTYYSVQTIVSVGWGETEWGESPWGDDLFSIAPVVRVQVPTQFKRFGAFTLLYRHKTAREHFSILHWALTLRPLSDKTTLIPRSSTA